MFLPSWQAESTKSLVKNTSHSYNGKSENLKKKRNKINFFSSQKTYSTNKAEKEIESIAILEFLVAKVQIMGAQVVYNTGVIEKCFIHIPRSRDTCYNSHQTTEFHLNNYSKEKLN